VDGRTAPSIEMWTGAGEFLDELRSQIKDRSFRPMPGAGTDDPHRRVVRERP
jgi:hypothetical protein